MDSRRFEIEDSRHADCPPDAVLDRILSPATWPAWQSEILSVDGPSHLKAGDVVRGDAKLLGFEVEGHSTSLEVTPDAYVEDVIVGVRMKVRYAVTGEGDGARVTHRLVSDLPAGPAGWILSLFLRRRLRRMQGRLLDDLVHGCARSASSGSAN